MTAYEEHLVNNGWSPEEATVMYQKFSDPTFGRDPEMMREYQPGFSLMSQARREYPVTVAPQYNTYYSSPAVENTGEAFLRSNLVASPQPTRNIIRPRPQQKSVAQTKSQPQAKPVQPAQTMFEPERYLSPDELKQRMDYYKAVQQSKLNWNQGANLEGAYDPRAVGSNYNADIGETSGSDPIPEPTKKITVSFPRSSQPDTQYEAASVALGQPVSNAVELADALDRGDLTAIGQFGVDINNPEHTPVALPQISQDDLNAVARAYGVQGAALLSSPWLARGASSVWNLGKHVFKGTPKPASQVQRQKIREMRKLLNSNEPVPQDFPGYESAFDTLVQGQANNPVWNIPGYLRYRNIVDSLNRVPNPNVFGSRAYDLRWALPN